jgi:hypothetical protein
MVEILGSILALYVGMVTLFFKLHLSSFDCQTFYTILYIHCIHLTLHFSSSLLPVRHFLTSFCFLLLQWKSHYLTYIIFYYYSLWGETDSTWYCGHNWPIVLAKDDRWWWLWSSRWNEDWQEKPKYSEETCPSVTSSITNPTWPHLGSNPSRRGGKSATNHLSYGTALSNIYTFSLFVSSVALSPSLEFVSGIYVGCVFIIRSCSLRKTRFRGCVMPRRGSPTEGKYCIREEVSGKAILVSS